MMPDYVIQDLTPESNLEAFKCAEGDLNDFLVEETDKTTANRINRKIPNSKRRKHYPALKIGRLAVDTRYAGMGMGEEILRTIRTMFRFGNRTGCRFLTVDALASATGFYQAKGNFRFFTEKDKDDDTRLMYFDLKDFG
jgi:predicted GNAT family N-acyltransferase